MSDNRLGINISTTGVDTSAADIQRLTVQVNTLRDALANLGKSNLGGSSDLAKNLQVQLAAAEASLKSLTASQIQNYAATESFSVRAIAAMRGQADAIKGTAAEMGAQDAIMRAGANSARVLTQSTQAAIAATTGLGTATRLTKAEIAEITEAFGGEILVLDKLASAQRRVGAGGGAAAGRELRHGVAIFDELAAGRRGQMVGTIGSMLRDSGAGSGAMMGGLGGLIALMGGAGIIHATENMAKWAEQVQAGAAVAGMSVKDYSSLQGALTLTGMKAEAADSTLRKLATSTEEAVANSSSRAAKAFNALGISQAEIVGTGGNAEKMLQLLAKAFTETANGANKSAAFQAIFGRSLAELVPLLSRGGDGIKELQEKAQALGITLDEKTAAALAATGEKINILGATIRGQGIQSFIAWLPAINNAIDELSKLVGVAGQVVSAIGKIQSAISSFTGGFSLGGLFPAGAGLGLARKLFGDMIPGGTGPVGTATLDPVDITARRPVSAFDTKTGGANKDITSDIAALRTSLQGLRHDYELTGAMQDAIFDKARLQAHLQQADRDISPMQRAQQDYNAYKDAINQKETALNELQTKTDAVYDQMIQKAQEVYDKDPKLYKEAIVQKENADKEFAVQHQKLQNQLLQSEMELVDAHKQAVDAVVKEWGSAFDKIGSDFESTIVKILKGQTTLKQGFADLAASIGEDLAKELGKSLMKSLATKLFGEGTSSFGEGIAKLLGIGSDKGLLGTGLSAVHGVSEVTGAATSTGASAAQAAGSVAQLTTNTAATTVNTTAMLTNTAALATSSATKGASAIGSSFEMLKTAPQAAEQAAQLIGNTVSTTANTTALATNTAALATSAAGSAAGGAGSAVGGLGSAGGIFSAVTSLFAFKSGGIVPSAAGGMILPNVAGGIPMIGHPKEMVLPSHISEGLQGLIAGGGANYALHFHGPSDAPSIARWFQTELGKHLPSATLNTFFRGGLTPRMLSNRPA